MRTLCFLFSFFLLALPATARQQPSSVRYQKIAEDFIANYNRQDFSAMRAPFAGAIKLVLSEKVVRAMFEKRYAQYGRIVPQPGDIDGSGGYVTMRLRYEKDTSFQELLNFYFSGNDKIAGLRFREDPYLIYPPRIPVADKNAEVDSILARNFPDGFSGTVLFAKGNDILLHRNYGFNNMRTQVPVNDSSVFELASLSKQFTAAAILKLIEQGKLSEEDSLRRFFPELPYSGVKIHHLIYHMAGLPEYEDLMLKKSIRKQYCDNSDVIRMLAEKHPKPSFLPGQSWEYSNTGYVLLASIIEQVSGMSYGAYLQQEFFGPLGMTHTRVYNTRRVQGEVIPNYAYGFVYEKKDKAYHLPDSTKDKGPMVTKLDGIVGDGTVNSTAPDLARWSTGLNHGLVLSQASLDKAYTDSHRNNGRANNYGYGVEVDRKSNYGRIAAHTGGWPGYQTVMYRFPDADKVLVILCNREHPDNDGIKAARQLSALYIGQ